MNERGMRRVAVGLTFGVVVAAVGILNVGVDPLPAAAAECREGGGGAGSPSPSRSASPSGSPSPSPSNTGGVITPPVIFPSSPSPSPSPSGSASPSPSGGDGAGKTRCPTRVTIRYERVGTRTSDPRDHFEGAVRSPEKACVGDRQVVLKKKRGNRFQTVGRTVTNGRGKWRINQPGANGRYRAHAPKAQKRRGRLVCERGGSRTLRV